MFHVITIDDDDDNLFIWGTFDHHSLVEVLPYFMKMNHPERFYIVSPSDDSAMYKLEIVYHSFAKEGRYS